MKISRNTYDERIVCLDLKKVYSCLFGAAFATQDRASDIKACCDRYSLYTVHRHKYQYYWKYCEIMGGKPEILDTRKPPVEISVKDTEYYKILKLGIDLKSYFLQVTDFYNSMVEYLDREQQWGKILDRVEVYTIYIEYIHRTFGEKYSLSQNKFVRQLKYRMSTYERILGAEEYEIYSDTSHRYVMLVKFTKACPREEISEIPPDQLRAISPTGKGIPVIETTSDTIFGSIKSTAKHYGMNSEWVRYCCDGDIDSIYRSDGSTLRFSYVKYV